MKGGCSPFGGEVKGDRTEESKDNHLRVLGYKGEFALEGEEKEKLWQSVDKE